MKSSIIFTTLPLLISAYLVEPDTPAAPDTIEDCTYWVVADETSTCADVTKYWGITLQHFTIYNPSVGEPCTLLVGNSYCIEQNWGIAPTPSSTNASATISSTPTPTPTSLMEFCLAEGNGSSGYGRYCDRCVSKCANTQYVSECFNSVFSTMNYYDSQCWQHGGNDCSNKAADIVCPRT